MAGHIDKTAALDMLGMGIKPVNVAAALGCDPSYISQLLSDPQFAEQVAAKRVAAARQGAEMDALADAIEGKALQNLEKYMGFINDPMKLLKVVETMNRVKRRTASDLQPQTGSAQIVNVILPQVMVKNFTVSQNNEVIEVDGQSLLTMPSQNFKQMVRDGVLTPVKEIEHAPIEASQDSGS